jgi:hypothetical protein
MELEALGRVMGGAWCGDGELPGPEAGFDAYAEACCDHGWVMDDDDANTFAVAFEDAARETERAEEVYARALFERDGGPDLRDVDSVEGERERIIDRIHLAAELLRKRLKDNGG